MATFKQESDGQPRRPARTLTVPPNAFKDTWEHKPSSAVCCGLRLVGAGDVGTARAEAAAHALDMVPDDVNVEQRNEAYYDALIRYAVAHGTCDPNDVNESWDLLGEFPEEVAFEAFTKEGLRMIYRAVDELAVLSDPSRREATDEDVNAIVEALVESTASPASIRMARRFLSAAAEELGVLLP